MSVDLAGFEALIAELRDAPDHIRAEAMGIVKDTTEAAAREIAATYPQGPTGNLKNRVKTSYPSESLLVGIVRSTAPHSHLWEFGTRARQTKNGASRGKMPAHKGRSEKVTPTIAAKHRTQMFIRLKNMLRDMGFQVSDSGR